MLPTLYLLALCAVTLQDMLAGELESLEDDLPPIVRLLVVGYVHWDAPYIALERWTVRLLRLHPEMQANPPHPWKVTLT
jgi:hypothetical protein